jgi:hypothetical protein
MTGNTLNKRLGDGVRVRVADGWYGAGWTGLVIGRGIFVGQWWCPVLWDGADEPDFHKLAGLELSAD